MSSASPATLKGRFAALLALAAMLTVLVRPVCAAQEMLPGPPQGASVPHALGAPQAAAHPDTCCDALQDVAIAAPVELAVPAAVALSQAPALGRAPLRVAFAQLPFGAAPPPPLPYHTRSARIQR